MRILLILSLAAIPALAQNPAVRITNTTRPAASDFQVDDHFEILITGMPSQPVSARTEMQGRTDWGPVIGSTDSTGRWSITGQFDKNDFGAWTEVWTVGGKLANPAVHFSVNAPCLKAGQGPTATFGPNVVMSCETADGSRTFATPSGIEPFRTPDGRLVPWRTALNVPAEQYRTQTLQSLVNASPQSLQASYRGDSDGALILKLIGVNALSNDETRNVLAIIHAAFEVPDRIPQEAKVPTQTLRLLQSLSDSTTDVNLKQQIVETIAYVQAR